MGGAPKSPMYGYHIYTAEMYRDGGGQQVVAGNNQGFGPPLSDDA